MCTELLLCSNSKLMLRIIFFKYNKIMLYKYLIFIFGMIFNFFFIIFTSIESLRYNIQFNFIINYEQIDANIVIHNENKL